MRPKTAVRSATMRKRSAVHGLQLGTGDDPSTGVQPGLARQRGHGVRVVAGDDAHVHAHLAEARQRLGGILAQDVPQDDEGVRPGIGRQDGGVALVGQGRGVGAPGGQQDALALGGMVGDEALDVAPLVVASRRGSASGTSARPWRRCRPAGASGLIARRQADRAPLARRREGRLGEGRPAVTLVPGELTAAAMASLVLLSAALLATMRPTDGARGALLAHPAAGSARAPAGWP